MSKLFITLVHWYQKGISPYTPDLCRYTPTCSTYMIIAIKRFGCIRGIIMGTARILRCNPFNRGGYDPVPHHFTIFRNKNY